MNSAFKHAINLLMTIIHKYDGKSINKRFIDAANYLFDEQNIPVRISFEKDYRNTRIQRFTLTYTDRSYGTDGRYYLEYNSTINTLYPGSNPDYLDDNFKLISENLVTVLSIEFTRLTELNNDYSKGIEQADSVISLYKDLNDYVQTHLDKIPKCLRDNYSRLKCPIY